MIFQLVDKIKKVDSEISHKIVLQNNHILSKNLHSVNQILNNIGINEENSAEKTSLMNN